MSKDKAVTVEQFIEAVKTGAPLPEEAFVQDQPQVVPLNLSQRLAMRAAQNQVQAAQAVLAQVMRECGLDPNKKYGITNEGATIKE